MISTSGNFADNFFSAFPFSCVVGICFGNRALYFFQVRRVEYEKVKSFSILDEHEMNLSFLKILLFCLINEINRIGFHISRIFITMVVPFSIDNEPVYCMTAVVIFHCTT